MKNFTLYDYVNVMKEANYIIKTKSTVRETAKFLKRSKTTVHHDLRHKLRDFDYEKYLLVAEILDINLEERAIRGGLANKEKHLAKRR